VQATQANTKGGCISFRCGRRAGYANAWGGQLDIEECCASDCLARRSSFLSIIETDRCGMVGTNCHLCSREGFNLGPGTGGDDGGALYLEEHSKVSWNDCNLTECHAASAGVFGILGVAAAATTPEFPARLS
jgi:hypothetical protein